VFIIHLSWKSRSLVAFLSIFPADLSDRSGLRKILAATRFLYTV
jgi:hypothetical protein